MWRKFHFPRENLDFADGAVRNAHGPAVPDANNRTKQTRAYL